MHFNSPLTFSRARPRVVTVFNFFPAVTDGSSPGGGVSLGARFWRGRFLALALELPSVFDTVSDDDDSILRDDREDTAEGRRLDNAALRTPTCRTKGIQKKSL